MNILELLITWVLSHPSIDTTILVAAYEVVVRKLHTTVSISVLDFIKTTVDQLCPNKVVKQVVDDSITKVEKEDGKAA